MIWPSWLWIGTPLKFFLWLSNRVATWTGSLYVWKRLRATRHVWWGLLVLNLVSWGGLCLLFFWLRTRPSH